MGNSSYNPPPVNKMQTSLDASESAKNTALLYNRLSDFDNSIYNVQYSVDYIQRFIGLCQVLLVFILFIYLIITMYKLYKKFSV
jgi:hypothetical protein